MPSYKKEGGRWLLKMEGHRKWWWQWALVSSWSKDRVCWASDGQRGPTALGQSRQLPVLWVTVGSLQAARTNAADGVASVTNTDWPCSLEARKSDSKVLAGAV